MTLLKSGELTRLMMAVWFSELTESTFSHSKINWLEWEVRVQLEKS